MKPTPEQIRQGMLRRAAEHGCRPGSDVLRLSWERSGEPVTQLYRYSTAASHQEGWLERQGVPFTREYVKWDGEENVSLDNGD